MIRFSAVFSSYWTIISKTFNGKTRIEQHKMVYKALMGKMGNELHALELITEEKK